MDRDLFELYRWLLAIAGTIYTVIRLGQTAWNWASFLWTPSRSRRLIRRYAMLSVLRIRLRKFTLDFAEIGALTAVLAGLLWLHGRLGYLNG